MVALLLAAILAAPALIHAQGAPKISLAKAAVTAEAKNDERQVIAPASGQTFLWVTAAVAGAPTTIDLTKITLTSGAMKGRLVGVDAVYDGDPKEFSMIADVHLKTGAVLTPLEETKSVGTIGFAFTPGKTATVKVVSPPQSFCLLFEVPAALKSGTINGLGPTPLPVPALSSGRDHN
jgi:hypothetical protein